MKNKLITGLIILLSLLITGSITAAGFADISEGGNVYIKCGYQSIYEHPPEQDDIELKVCNWFKNRISKKYRTSMEMFKGLELSSHYHDKPANYTGNPGLVIVLQVLSQVDKNTLELRGLSVSANSHTDNHWFSEAQTYVRKSARELNVTLPMNDNDFSKLADDIGETVLTEFNYPDYLGSNSGVAYAGKGGLKDGKPAKDYTGGLILNLGTLAYSGLYGEYQKTTGEKTHWAIGAYFWWGYGGIAFGVESSFRFMLFDLIKQKNGLSGFFIAPVVGLWLYQGASFALGADIGYQYIKDGFIIGGRVGYELDLGGYFAGSWPRWGAWVGYAF